MAPVYLAHIRKDDLDRQGDSPIAQPLSEHLRNVAELMSAFAEAAGLSSTAYLIGILHDLGKCSEAFAEYLSWSLMRIPETTAAGGRWIIPQQAGSSSCSVTAEKVMTDSLSLSSLRLRYFLIIRVF